jgi:hypothetical protein
VVESVDPSTGTFVGVGGNQGPMRRNFPIGGCVFLNRRRRQAVGLSARVLCLLRLSDALFGFEVFGAPRYQHAPCCNSFRRAGIHAAPAPIARRRPSTNHS